MNRLAALFAIAACGQSPAPSSEPAPTKRAFTVAAQPQKLELTILYDNSTTSSTFKFEHEFTFEDQDGRTLLTMAQRGFPTVELRDEHERGLPNAFARLASGRRSSWSR